MIFKRKFFYAIGTRLAGRETPFFRFGWATPPEGGLSRKNERARP
jgi:hypothetical protein